MKTFNQALDELLKVLELGRQQWLLGAGASVESGIPLMYPLTARVKASLAHSELKLFEAVMKDLPGDAHVEHVLSHLGDLMALASRSRTKLTHMSAGEVTLDELKTAYRAIVQVIAKTVRYGYRPAHAGAPESVGTSEAPIVDIDAHVQFVRQIFRGRANLEPRSQIGFITTNYDTLLEDALAMERRVALDGFAGGAIAYWNGESIDPGGSAAVQAHRVLKLHGSVDWFNEPQSGLFRTRYGVKYLSDLASTMIYPQATKYIETQKDPFARIFDCFRRTLQSPEHHMLGIVGYSFGDDHINSEIESALAAKGSKTVVVAFSKEITTGGAAALCGTLRRWLADGRFASRIYVASDLALYNGANRFTPSTTAPLAWWTFSGLTKFLENGVAA